MALGKHRKRYDGGWRVEGAAGAGAGDQLLGVAGARCFRKSAVKQRDDLIVAALGALPTRDDGDDAAAIVIDGADDVEAGGVGVARLDAVDALVARQQAVMATDRLVAKRSLVK